MTKKGNTKPSTETVNEAFVYETRTNDEMSTNFFYDNNGKYTLNDKAPGISDMSFTEINGMMMVIDRLLTYYENMAQANKDIEENKIEYNFAIEKIRRYRKLQVIIIEGADEKFGRYTD